MQLLFVFVFLPPDRDNEVHLGLVKGNPGLDSLLTSRRIMTWALEAAGIPNQLIPLYTPVQRVSGRVKGQQREDSGVSRLAVAGLTGALPKRCQSLTSVAEKNGRCDHLKLTEETLAKNCTEIDDAGLLIHKG